MKTWRIPWEDPMKTVVKKSTYVDPNTGQQGRPPGVLTKMPEKQKEGLRYGVKIPFFKNTGVPRSYGEYGILMSMAWAYWLVNFDRLAHHLRAVSGILLVAAIFVSQSRSTYLAVLVVTGAYCICSIIT